MSDKLLCPFCQQELEKDCDWVYGCPNRKCKAFGYFFGARELWQALIDTKKKLDIAVDALDAGRTLARIAGFEMLAAGMDAALEQIKDNDKDVK